VRDSHKDRSGEALSKGSLSVVRSCLGSRAGRTRGLGRTAVSYPKGWSFLSLCYP
jgi:hypothetical protein